MNMMSVVGCVSWLSMVCQQGGAELIVLSFCRSSVTKGLANEHAKAKAEPVFFRACFFFLHRLLHQSIDRSIALLHLHANLSFG